MYPAKLRSTVFWPCFGNHDGGASSSPTQTGPYYNIFNLPMKAESNRPQITAQTGTEAYYSFDYAGIHFIALNSYDIDRAKTGAMVSWLEADLNMAFKVRSEV